MEHNLLEVLEFKMPFQLNQNSLLSEHNISNMMNAFYLAIIGSIPNTELLLTKDPWEISQIQFTGKPDCFRGMIQFCEFLEFVKMISKDEGVYNEQFLKPVELATSYLKNKIRNMDNQRSSDLDGWIFARSKPSKTNKHAKEREVTVSAVFPQLQTVMSASIPENITTKNTSHYHQFKKCQPIPLVNRIHQTGKNASIQENKTVLLSEFNFLFTSFSDIKLLGTSIEMENFCETDSKQSEVKKHLGFPFVSFGKVMPSTRGAKIQIKSITDESNQTFSVSEHYNFKENDPDELREKYVRFFGITWYDANYDDDVDLEKSEIFLMQEEKDLERLRFENMLGHIRLRSNVSKSEAEKDLGQEIKSDDDCIEIDNNMVKFRYSVTDEYIPKEFVKTMLEIRELREKYKQNSPRVSKEQLIDPEKLAKRNNKGIVKTVRILFEMLFTLQNKMDTKATVNKLILFSIFKSQVRDEELIKKRYRWLKFLEMIEEDEINIRLTDLGKEALLYCCKDSFSQLCKSKKVIKLEDIEKYNVPTSIFRKYIKNTSEFHPLKLNDGMETEVVWIKEGNSEPHEEIINDLVKKREKILEIMGSVWHPVTVEMITKKFEEEGNHLGSFIIHQLLTEIKETKVIRNDGESWEYPINSRMYDLFKKYPNDSFDVTTICDKCIIVKDDYNLPKVKNYLKDFEKSGEIGKINGKWISNVNIEKNREELKKKEIRAIALSILRKANFQTPKIETVSDRYWKKPPSNDHLGNEFVSEISKIYFNKNHSNVTDKEIKHEIDLMIKDGAIPYR